MAQGMDGSTRWSLIDGVRDGVPGSRDRFARRYEPIVRAYLGARWKASPLRQDLDDATQEVFALCFSSRSPLNCVENRREGGFRAYLHGVVSNVARGFERKQRRRREERAPTNLEIASPEDSASRVFEREWAQALLREAGELQRRRAVTADAERRVVILQLRFGGGLPVRDIAERVGLPPKQAHRQYARARREFQAALRDVVRSAEGCDEDTAERECRRLVGFFAQSARKPVERPKDGGSTQ